MPEYIERSKLIGIETLLNTGILRASKTASYIYDQMLYDIENIPTADVEPVRHGKWDYYEASISVRPHFRCSICNSPRYEHYVCNDFRYCPNCGAKMDL